MTITLPEKATIAPAPAVAVCDAAQASLRVRSLCVMAWPLDRIALLAGLPRDVIHDLAEGYLETVPVHYATALYELSETMNEAGRIYADAYANRQGWYALRQRIRRYAPNTLGQGPDEDTATAAKKRKWKSLCALEIEAAATEATVDVEEENERPVSPPEGLKLPNVKPSPLQVKRAKIRLESLRYVLEGMTPTRAANRAGCGPRTVERIRDQVGIRTVFIKGSSACLIDPECAEIAAEVAEVIARYDRYEVTAFQALCLLGAEPKPVGGASVKDVVDAAPVREHVLNVMASGRTQESIAKEVGVTAMTVSLLLHGDNSRPPTKNMQRSNAEALMAVQPLEIPEPDNRRVDGTAARQMLRSLAVIGWPYPEMSRRSGIPRTTIRRMTEEERLVKASSLPAVFDLYQELKTEPGPCKDTSAAAYEAGWRPLEVQRTF